MSRRRILTLIIAVVVILAACLVHFMTRRTAAPTSAITDQPPVIEFTWTPDGPADLKTVTGHLKMTDDRALDFSSYLMTISEISRKFDFGVTGVIGREYETDLHFSWLANDQALAEAGQMTLIFEIADDAGHKAAITKTIPLKQ
jgi:hypothetical protein